MLDLTAKSVARHLLKSRGVTLVGEHTQHKNLYFIYNSNFFFNARVCKASHPLSFFPF